MNGSFFMNLESAKQELQIFQRNRCLTVNCGIVGNGKRGGILNGQRNLKWESHRFKCNGFQRTCSGYTVDRSGRRQALEVQFGAPLSLQSGLEIKSTDLPSARILSVLALTAQLPIFTPPSVTPTP